MSQRRSAVYLLLIACLVAGLFTGRAFFFNIAYVLFAVLLIALVWSWLAVRWLGISRRTYARNAQVGRTLEERFEVVNRGLLPKLWIEIDDGSTLPGHRADQVVPLLLPMRGYRWDVKTTCIVRGEFRLGPITIISGDPFGLFLSPRKLAATSRVIVYPQIVPIPQFALPYGVLSGGGVDRRRAQFTTTNAAGVRDYVTGDSYNRIHWATSARRDRLMVKEFEIDPKVDVWVFIDFSAASLVEESGIQRIDGNGFIIPRTTGIPPSSEEYAAVIGASLVRFFVDSERSLGFAAYVPHREVYQPERGIRQLLRVLETLALARSHSQYTLAQMLILETPYFTRGTTLVIVTASLDPAWISEAQMLMRKGIRPVCILIDPASFGGVSVTATRNLLLIARIPTIVIRKGDDLTAALSQQLI